ncbi:DMT family transporter [Cetobacterium somerae]|uniref:DMT family transporter n=1 Tax=Cetobacterium sp. NK01 TaxID=2993530 RepID=UPI0021170AED|nr:DMT family transporter [Cetobacterium sp. NK01]MCQ8212679.1 DMT family transporter [Cetobacterium sp. NK01]
MPEAILKNTAEAKYLEREERILALKEKSKKDFLKKGIKIGLISGALYGTYTALLTLGMTRGVWADWYGANTSGLTTFVIVYLLAALGNAINDTCSAVWALGNAGYQGKLKDLMRTLNTKPGKMLMLAAMLGGPVAGTAYVIALQMAGSIIVPISALCPAIAAILGKIFYKQEINRRMAFGILICVSASFIIGSSSFGEGISPEVLLGITIAIVAAFGWGFEGCVAGYASAMVDPQIGICIRQLTSGLTNMFIVLPILGILSGDISTSFTLVSQAFTSTPAMIWFILSGLATFVSFTAWYTGNSMCGAGLGTACNGTYSFFGPFFCWIILGVVMGIDGWALPAIVWIGALLMIFGILMIAVNPMDFLKKKEA